MSVLLGFTLAAYNLDRIRSFRAKHGLERTNRCTESQRSPPRPKRRRGTWAELIEPTTTGTTRLTPASIAESCSSGDKPMLSRPTRSNETREHETAGHEAGGFVPWGGRRARTPRHLQRGLS